MSETLFISDLHLSPERPGTVSLLVDFLGNRARAADSLYILGDLFDTWIGDDHDSDLANQIRKALKSLSNSGTRVFFQHGNRDFLIGNQFLRQTGAELIDEATVIDLYGQPTLLMHGDLLCTDDLDYQQARKMLRSEAFINDFLSKTLPEREAIAAAYRQQSGEAVSLKAEDIMDVNQKTVMDNMRQHKVALLIHGHTHRPGDHVFDLDGHQVRRLVLAEWHQDLGEVLVANRTGLHKETVH